MKKVAKKLVLNKSAIAILNKVSASEVFGGTDYDSSFCPIPDNFPFPQPSDDCNQSDDYCRPGSWGHGSFWIC